IGAGLAHERAQPEGRAVLPHVPAAVHIGGRQRTRQIPAARRDPRGTGARLASALRVRDPPFGRARPWGATLARAALGRRAHQPRRALGTGATVSAGYGPWALPPLACGRCDSSGSSWLERSPSL